MSSPRSNVKGKIRLERIVSNGKLFCDNCRYGIAQGYLALVLHNAAGQIFHFHQMCELDLLQALLNNYAKRLGKKKLTIFLKKEPEADATGNPT